MTIRITRILSLSLLILVMIPSLRTQSLSRDLKEILELQDSRSLGDGKLVSYLQSRDKYTRYRAAIALANLQDTSTVASIAPLLRDEDVQVRAAAAFALGQIGTASAQKALVDALAPEQDMMVLPRLFEALGKCGNADALNSVVAYIPSARNIAVKHGQALSIARFALRRITSERAVWLCFDLLKDNHPEMRSAALYALWRSAPLGVIDVEISNRAYLLVKLMSDKEAEIGINLASLLGRTKSDEASRLLKMFYEAEEQDPDWRVQVQLARSAGMRAKADPHLVEILLSYLSNQNEHVRIASLMALAALDSVTVAESGREEKLRTMLVQLASKPSKGAILVQGESMVTLARILPKDFFQDESSFVGIRSDNLLRAKYVEALSYCPTSVNLRRVMGFLGDDSVRVAMAAWDFLKRMLQPPTFSTLGLDSAFVDSIPSLLAENAEVSLRKNDVALTTLAANMFADSSVFRMFVRSNLIPRISNDFSTSYKHLTSVDGAEAMVAVQQEMVQLGDTSVTSVLTESLDDPNRTVALGAAAALTKITGRTNNATTSGSSVPIYKDDDWKTLESIKASQRVVFKTSKGIFTIRLRKEDAPFTVLAFYTLVKQKFYNGLTFHRVVPGFVIQGGDPRGDGWGGPGFVIRSEWSLATFERGSVGMASSGKDTEGCQFFVTYDSAPHLDGRYTVFATVTTGMDVVDKIEVGDRILSAEIR